MQGAGVSGGERGAAREQRTVLKADVARLKAEVVLRGIALQRAPHVGGAAEGQLRVAWRGHRRRAETRQEVVHHFRARPVPEPQDCSTRLAKEAPRVCTWVFQPGPQAGHMRVDRAFGGRAGCARILLVQLLLIDRHRRPAASPVLVAANLLLRPPRGVAGAAAERDAAHGDVLLVRAVPRWEEASAARTEFGHGTQLIWHQARYISQAEALHTAPASYRSNWRYISLALHIGPAAMCSAGAGTYRPGLLCTASGNIAQHWREKRSRDHTTSG